MTQLQLDENESDVDAVRCSIDASVEIEAGADSLLRHVARSPASLFAEAIAQTRARSPSSFDQWFSGVQFDALVDGVLTLRARDEFVREWVDDHFIPAIADSIRRETGWSVSVAWSIDASLSSPVSTQTPQIPVRARPLSVRPSSFPPSSMPPSSAGAFGASSDGLASVVIPKMAPLGSDIAFANAASSSSPRAGVQTTHADNVVPARGDLGAPSAGVELVAPPISGLNEKNTFGNFVVGPSNQLAHAAAFACAGGGGRRHNPLFICGGTGLGKTHLVHAVAYTVRASRPSTRILYLSAERFVNEFVQALQDQQMNAFRARYRDKCDLLLVDDIQFLAGKTQTQEEFFHAFNSLHQAGKQIIVTSDKYPQQLEKMEERLISRFTWGLVADIQAPELETRVAIVRKKAALEHIELADDVTLYIAQTVRSNVRELEGTLIRLAAKASLLGCPIDLLFTKTEISSSATTRLHDASVEDIQRAVCHHFKLRSNDLLSKDRHRSIAFARHVAMYLCKQRLKCSFPELGRAFGNRDHTTVMSAVRKVEQLRGSDPEVRAHIEALERKLGTND